MRAPLAASKRRCCVITPRRRQIGRFNESFLLSYDLGIQGDYCPLYVWLDNAKARECGDSTATFEKEASREQVAKELQRVVKRKGRLYLVGRNKANKVVGGFIVGGRNRPPWAGYGRTEGESDEEEA